MSVRVGINGFGRIGRNIFRASLGDPEIEYVERNVQRDHVHIVVSFPPKYSIAQVVQILKTNTGKALKEKFPYLRQRYWGAGGMWSVGYFASTVGLDEEMVKRYVRYQEKEDRGQTKFAF